MRFVQFRQNLTSSRNIGITECLDVLPSSSTVTPVLTSKSRETKALANITLGSCDVRQGSEDLVPVVVGGASDEARSTLALVDVLAEAIGEGAAWGVLEGAGGGAVTHVAGVRHGEAEGTVGVDIDGLAAGNLDILL